MITFNEGNILDIENECGGFSLEDDVWRGEPGDLDHVTGMSIRIDKPEAALTMVGLYTKEELKTFLENTRHCVIKSTLHSSLIGRKKVLETIFSTVDVGSNDESKKDYKVIFKSEDTTYHYRMSEEEWDEMVSLMTWVTNGYKK